MARINPLLPAQVAKFLGTNTIMASAILSELTSKGVLKVSNIKIGSSPLYYPPSEKHKLQNYSQHLNQKDKQAFEILKEKKLLRDIELDPLTRVSLRQLKDFSIPLEVIFDDKKEIFWKWYLLEDLEAEKIIKEKLNFQQLETPQKEMPQETTSEQEIRKPIKKPRSIKKTITRDNFSLILSEYFNKKEVTVLEKLDSNSKAFKTFILEIRSSIGPLKYYCEAVSKKRISEKDLNNAFVNGQLRKLPVLFLTNGELTKKAKEILKELKGVALKKI